MEAENYDKFEESNRTDVAKSRLELRSVTDFIMQYQDYILQIITNHIYFESCFESKPSDSNRESMAYKTIALTYCARFGSEIKHPYI